eukprot:467814_1
MHSPSPEKQSLSPSVRVTALQLLSSLNAQPDPSLPKPIVFTTAYESYRKRKMISNIMVILFLQHPIGVLQTELPLFYQQCYNEPFAISNHLKSILYAHKNIMSTRISTRGILYTLRSDALPFIMATLDPQTICAVVTYHIQKIFRCYPNGISCDCFQQVFHNMVQIRLSKIVSSWFHFVRSIPSIYCINIHGNNVFIQMNDLNAITVQKQKEHSGDVASFLMVNLNAKSVLKHCYGYDELLMALFHEHNMTLNGVQLEEMFYKLYKCRLVYEAPFVQSKLKGICDLCCASNGVVQYSLSKQYVRHMKENICG